MTAIEILQEKFQATNSVNVTEWMAKTKVDLSLQSCTAVLLRGQDKGLICMLTLAVALGCTPEEIKMIAKEKGDNTLWKLITPDEMEADERKLLNAYRAMTPGQKKLLLGMVKELKP